MTLAAGKMYTMIDTAAGIAQAGIKTYQMATGAAPVSLGNIASVALGFAPGIGAVAGKFAKANGLTKFLNFEGCFVAGTPIHLQSITAQREHLVSSFHGSKRRGDEFAEDQFDIDFEEHDNFLGSLEIESWHPRAHTVAIEQVSLGDRIATKNPKRWEVEPSIGEPDETWLKVCMTVVKSSGSIVDVELLRPHDWLGEFALEVGTLINLRISELEVDGSATITSIEPCPPIAEGDGQIVTGRFATRQVDEVVTLVLEDDLGQREELIEFYVHMDWSVDRHGCVAATRLH
jgi:hypothetical protein